MFVFWFFTLVGVLFYYKIGKGVIYTMNNELISVIVPVYKAESFITQCIDSVIAQTYKDWELIIINDCSPDNSECIIMQYIKKYPNKIRYITNVVNLGQGISRNKGLSLADGKWLFFLDSDDSLEVNCFEKLIFEANYDSYDIVLGNSYRLRASNKVNLKIDLIKLYHFSRYSLGMYAWGTLFDRQFWQKHNFMFDSFRFAEDLLLISRVWASTNKIKVINDPLYNYRVNQNSMTHQFHSYANIKLTLEKLLQFTCINNNSDELTAFALSNSYNLIKMVASPISRYKLFIQLKCHIPIYPQNNKFVSELMINKSKAKKLRCIYATNGLYFFWKIDGRIFRNLVKIFMV